MSSMLCHLHGLIFLGNWPFAMLMTDFLVASRQRWTVSCCWRRRRFSQSNGRRHSAFVYDNTRAAFFKRLTVSTTKRLLQSGEVRVKTVPSSLSDSVGSLLFQIMHSLIFVPSSPSYLGLNFDKSAFFSTRIFSERYSSFCLVEILFGVGPRSCEILFLSEAFILQRNELRFLKN